MRSFTSLLHYYFSFSLYYVVCPLFLTFYTFKTLGILVSEGNIFSLLNFVIFVGWFIQYTWVLSQAVLTIEKLRKNFRPHVIKKDLRTWNRVIVVAREHGFALEKPRIVSDRLDKWGGYHYILLIANEKCFVTVCSLSKAFIPFFSIPPRNVVVIEYRKEGKINSVKKIIWPRIV